MRIFSISSSSKSARFQSLTVLFSTPFLHKKTLMILNASRKQSFELSQMSDTLVDSSCKLLSIETLQARRTKLCLNFAIKSFRSNKFNLFKDDIKTFSHNLRIKQMFHLPFAATSRYYNSPRLYLCRLLQEHLSKTENKLG